jgi:hypothetical protein
MEHNYTAEVVDIKVYAGVCSWHARARELPAGHE